MSSSFISTSAISSPTRLAVMKLQRELSRLQTEISSGRRADVGLQLGAGTAELVGLRQMQSWHEALAGSNALAAARLDASQASLAGMEQTAQRFLDALLGARGSTAARTEIAGMARGALMALGDQLNTQLGDAYLFAGDNSGERPMLAYFASGSAARQGVATAFMGAFGIAQDDPAVGLISTADMQSFIDGAFSAEWSDAAWSANWSQASATNATARISVDETTEISTNANEPTFRKLAEAFVMVADLGGARLNAGTFTAVLDNAVNLVGSAMGELASIRSRLGTAQERIALSDERLSVQGNIIANRLIDVEQVDTYAAATAANTVMTQLQASYALTARISQLSLLNYL